MKKFIFYIVVLLIFFYFGPVVSSAFAASLQLDPTEISTPAGEIFKVKVTVDAGTDEIKSADAYIIYDPAILEPQTVEDGTFFDQVISELSTSGKASVTGLQDDPTKPVTGTGTIATITFKALADGTGALEFDCTAGSTNGSMILKADADGTNIIECTANGTSTVTIGAGATNPTGKPTVTPALPSQLPKSGVFENVVKFAVPGMILLFIGTAMRLLL